jgi:hypothetical protein
MTDLPKRFHIVKYSKDSGQRTIVRARGRPWIGTEHAAKIEAVRLAGAQGPTGSEQGFSYEVVEEQRVIRATAPPFTKPAR